MVFFLLLIFHIFLYGFDTAVRNLNEKEVERRAEEEKDKRSRRLLQIIDDPERFGGTMQMLTAFISMVAGALYLNLWMRGIEDLLARFAEQKLHSLPIADGNAALFFSVLAAVASAILLLYIFLTFGVVLPRKIAARIPEKWAYACIGPVDFLIRLFRPFTALVGTTVKGVLFLAGVRDGECDNDVTEEEIINMVQEGFEQGVLEDSEAEMISNIFAFGDKEAQDIMTHRNGVVAIDGVTKLRDAVDFMSNGVNSRYPVYEDSIDHVIGILHLKDAMRFHRDDAVLDSCVKDVDGLLREAHFVFPTQKIDDLFRELQSSKQQMAIVVDEFGQTDGLVTMEDILEEIVGNILDEYDEDTKYIQDNGNDEYIMEGKTPLEDLAERFGINFDGEEFETLNGFMIHRLDHIPEPGEEFEVDYQGYNFKILAVESKMVQSVLVTKLAPDVEEPESASAESTLEEKQ